MPRSLLWPLALVVSCIRLLTFSQTGQVGQASYPHGNCDRFPICIQNLTTSLVKLNHLSSFHCLWHTVQVVQAHSEPHVILIYSFYWPLVYAISNTTVPCPVASTGHPFVSVTSSGWFGQRSSTNSLGSTWVHNPNLCLATGTGLHHVVYHPPTCSHCLNCCCLSVSPQLYLPSACY